MSNMYRRGRIAEKKIVNDLWDKGFENVRRSAGSRGPADIYAVKNDQKYYFQIKSGSATANSDDIRRLRELARERHGTAVVVHRENGKNKWKFFGSW